MRFKNRRRSGIGKEIAQFRHSVHVLGLRIVVQIAAQQRIHPTVGRHI